MCSALRPGLLPWLSALLVALCLAAAYAAMGAAWIIYKTEGELQKKAVLWLRQALVFTALGMAAVSIATPFASPRIFDKWFVLPDMFYLSPLPILSGVLFVFLWWQTFHCRRPATATRSCRFWRSRRSLLSDLPALPGRSTPSWCPTV